MWRVTVTADYETEEEANKGLSEMEDAVGKTNGDLMESEAYDLENLEEL